MDEGEVGIVAGEGGGVGFKPYFPLLIRLVLFALSLTPWVRYIYSQLVCLKAPLGKRSINIIIIIIVNTYISCDRDTKFFIFFFLKIEFTGKVSSYNQSLSLPYIYGFHKR